VKGMQHVGGRESGHSRSMRPPAPVEQHASFPTQRSVQVGAAQLGSDDAIGRGRVSDPHMRDVPLAEKRTNVVAYCPLLRLGADDVCFE